MAYLLLALLIWVLISTKDKQRLTVRDAGILILEIGLFLFSMFWIYRTSSDMIQTILHTAYPGKRVDTGGDAGDLIFLSLFSSWMPLAQTGAFANSCESAFVLDFFPLNYLFLLYLIRRKKADSLLYCLLAVSLFLLLWIVIGFPAVLAKITMMSYVPAKRAVGIFGLTNLLMLIHELPLIAAEKKGRKGLLAVAIIISVGALVLAEKSFPDYLTSPQLILTGTILLVLTIGFVVHSHLYNRLWSFLFVLVMVVTGFYVNPVCRGVRAVETIPPLLMAKEIHQLDPNAIWAVTEDGYPYTNSLLMMGIPTINSTNVYPDLKRWEMLDPDRQYEPVYNRYAHIAFHVIQQDEDVSPKFDSLGYTDLFKVNVTYEDIKRLKIKYLFTEASYQDPEKYEMLLSNGSWKVYEVK